jgi:hypothetical protein
VVLTVEYVEIKCQLDATDEFLLQILLLAQHVSGTIMPIIRSSRLLYKWLLPIVFGAWFSSCRYVVELRVVCPVCGLQKAEEGLSCGSEDIKKECNVKCFDFFFFSVFLMDVMGGIKKKHMHTGKELEAH